MNGTATTVQVKQVQPLIRLSLFYALALTMFVILLALNNTVQAVNQMCS